MTNDDKLRNGTVGIAADSIESAKAEGLRYVSDAEPGIRRKKQGRAFVYSHPGGRPVRDSRTLDRIKSLAVPPAWTNVWICPLTNGHLQATGRDARGRKQYRYHPRWRRTRNESKYAHMIAFARALPKLRRRVRRDLKQPGLNREKVLATVVQLLETSLIRVGNEEYVRDNGSFGLTTMRARHVNVSGQKLHFHFRGKSGKEHSVEIHNGRLARIVARCQEIPGQELFQYVDEQGERRKIESGDINAYLREISGGDFTAKDFRTWAGTVLAVRALRKCEGFSSPTQARKNIAAAVEDVARRLGNTPAICRKSYVHPAIFDSYQEGRLLRLLKWRGEQKTTRSANGLPAEEEAVLGLLQRRLARETNDASLRKHLRASLRSERTKRAATTSAKWHAR
jgi:DNA topoisomerase-1